MTYRWSEGNAIVRLKKPVRLLLASRSISVPETLLRHPCSRGTGLRRNVTRNARDPKTLIGVPEILKIGTFRPPVEARRAFSYRRTAYRRASAGLRLRPLSTRCEIARTREVDDIPGMAFRCNSLQIFLVSLLGPSVPADVKRLKEPARTTRH